MKSKDFRLFAAGFVSAIVSGLLVGVLAYITLVRSQVQEELTLRQPVVAAAYAETPKEAAKLLMNVDYERLTAHERLMSEAYGNLVYLVVQNYEESQNATDARIRELTRETDSLVALVRRLPKQ